jgi:hypothetical protein
MIRRGFWLVSGAVLGVTGYRRATRLGRALGGQRARTVAGSIEGTGPIAVPRPRRGARSHVARAVATAGFMRDVRDGMAEYWELHRGQLDARSLEARSFEPRGFEPHSFEAHSFEARGDQTSSGL